MLKGRGVLFGFRRSHIASLSLASRFVRRVVDMVFLTYASTPPRGVGRSRRNILYSFPISAAQSGMLSFNQDYAIIHKEGLFILAIALNSSTLFDI